jgi:hypothetical protein
MAGSPFPQVNENAREEALSSDLNRASSLASKALQEELRRSALDSTGTPINCFTEVPSFAGVAATFNGALAAGEALVYDVTGIGPNDSPYKVMQWAAINLPFIAPDGANPRIDLVVATPVTIQTDNAVRNILLDPVARTFAPASVPKTSSPTVVPVVVTGTPGATPVTPAVPAGAVVLFEVYVPAAQPDATTFAYVPRLFRKTSYPWTGGVGEEPQTGVLRGCQLLYTGTFEAISQASLIGAENQVVIEGEVITFRSLSGLNSVDALNNPFAVAAPAGNDVPYFLYVCGGRGLPQNSGAYPAILIASLTPPDVKSGRPTLPLRTPRGDTQSACYVGIGAKVRGLTNHAVLRDAGGFAWYSGVLYYELVGPLAVDGGSQPLTFASAPSISDEMVIGISNVGDAAGTLVYLGLVVGAPLWTLDIAANSNGNRGHARLPINAGAGPHLRAHIAGGASTASFAALAYRTNVRRL